MASAVTHPVSNGQLWAGLRLCVGLVLLALLQACAHDRVSDNAGIPNMYNKPAVPSGTLFARLPVAVQNTLLTQTGSEHLNRVSTLGEPGNVVYEIHFEQPLIFGPIQVAHDGRILKRPEELVKGEFSEPPHAVTVTGSGAPGQVEEIPPAVADRIVELMVHNRHPYTLEREPWGDRLAYVVEAPDEPETRKWYIAEDGTILKETAP